MSDELDAVELVVTETNALAIREKAKAELVAQLRPIAERLPAYASAVAALRVTNQAEADAATTLRESIVTDQKTAEEALTAFGDGLIDRLHKLHRGWTGLRGRFSDALALNAKTAKRKVIEWQEAERVAAEAEQRRLQAQADAEAAKERARLEKEASKLKTPELREARMEQAAQVFAPVVTVAAPRAAVKVQKRWTVKAVDKAAFLAAAATDANLQGFIEIDTGRLQRSKANNPSMTVPGVTFEQVIV